MKKLLRYIFIVSIIAIIIIIAINIYKEIIMPKIFINDEKNIESEDEKINDILQNIVIKYITNIKNNINNIDYYIPIINRSNEKKLKYESSLKNFYMVKCFKYYKINESVYKVEYTIFANQDKHYSLIIEINKNENYFRVLYDEIFDIGKVE